MFPTTQVQIIWRHGAKMHDMAGSYHVSLTTCYGQWDYGCEFQLQSQICFLQDCIPVSTHGSMEVPGAPPETLIDSPRSSAEHVINLTFCECRTAIRDFSGSLCRDWKLIWCFSLRNMIDCVQCGCCITSLLYRLTFNPRRVFFSGVPLFYLLTVNSVSIYQ